MTTPALNPPHSIAGGQAFIIFGDGNIEYHLLQTDLTKISIVDRYVCRQPDTLFRIFGLPHPRTEMYRATWRRITGPKQA
jgi:hypothetical protein